jgi:hypothetical protein
MAAMRWAFVAAIGVLTLAVAALAEVPRLQTTPAAANPPGNNGTIKVDGVPFDDLPDNEPHVSCTFQIDFYGFDEGDLNADVLFEAIPPTGNGEDLLTDTVFIGEDDNSGGGSEAGLDASQTYDLTTVLQGLTAQPQQGYHIKLTIHADGSIGADTKYKVFWVGPCLPGPTPVATPPIPCPSPTPTPQSPGPTLPSTDTEELRGADTSDLIGVGPCPPPGPPPIIPESPFPILLPLSAAGLAIVALVLLRRRERRARAPTGEGRAEY